MKTYRIKVRQVYIETMFVEAESQQDAIELMWSDDCGIVDSEYKSAEAEIQSVEVVSRKLINRNSIMNCTLDQNLDMSNFKSG